MNAVVELKPTQSVPATPMEMLAIAVQQDADLDLLQKLMDLQERWEANEARKAFVRAMAAFKANPPEILKRKHVNIPGGAKFAHATLAEVVDASVAEMSKHGLSHRWATRQEDGAIIVTCIVTHDAGHSESNELRAAPDDSGKKNSIQQVASTVTYLERYTLMAALGLAAKDMDNDGNGAGRKADPVEVPEGFENWKHDMTARADEGLEALTSSWKASADALRRHVIKHHDDWWSETKAKAVQADKKAKAS